MRHINQTRIILLGHKLQTGRIEREQLDQTVQRASVASERRPAESVLDLQTAQPALLQFGLASVHPSACGLDWQRQTGQRGVETDMRGKRAR